MARGSILLLVLAVLAGSGESLVSGADGAAARLRAERRPDRGVGGDELRDAARVAALIEDLDLVSKSADALPLHALDLSLRKAVERELAEGQVEHSRGRAQRIERAARIGSSDQGLKRDEAYSTPVSSWVDPTDPPTVKNEKRAGRKSSPADEAAFERQRRKVVIELSQLDGVLDEAGVSARRDLLMQLLEIARRRDEHRRQQDAPD